VAATLVNGDTSGVRLGQIQYSLRVQPSSIFTSNNLGPVVHPPEEVASVELPEHSLSSVAVTGDYVYVTLADCIYFTCSVSLQVIDVTNPAQPRRVGSLDVPGGAFAVTVTNDGDSSGRYGYLAAGDVGVWVVDASDPAQPHLIGPANTPGRARGIVVLDDLAYVGDDKGGLLNLTRCQRRMKFTPVVSVLLLLALLSLTACDTLPATPTVDGLRVVSFTVTPNPAERGSSVTVTWNVAGASRVTLWRMRYESKMCYWYRLRPPETTGPATGKWTIAVPHDATWQRTATVNQPHWDLKFELEATDGSGNSVVVTSEEIRFICHPLFFDLNVTWTTCAHAPQITEAIFQPFEHGYMIWRADTGQVYALLQHPEHPNLWRVHLPTGPAVDIGVPPTGLYAPGEHFREIWKQLDEFWQSVLGWATARERAYDLTLQLSLMGGHPIAGHDDLYVSWPDGRVAHLIVYLSAQNYDAGPHWDLNGDINTNLHHHSPLTQ
jgi:hypothetical protein